MSLGATYEKDLYSTPSSGICSRCMPFSFFFFSSRRRHTRCSRDWSSDVCSSDLDVDRAHAPVAKNGRRKPMVQPLFAFTKRQFVNQGEFEVVRDVELADGFLEAPVVLIGRR